MRARRRQIEVLKRFALRQTVVANRRDGSISAALRAKQRGRKTLIADKKAGGPLMHLARAYLANSPMSGDVVAVCKVDFCLLGN